MEQDTASIKNVALIGLGPHARKIYYPYLEKRLSEKKDIILRLVIELDINRKLIDDYVSSRKLKPEKIIYLDARTQISPNKIDPEVKRLLRTLKITHAILATDPKSHKVYLEECIRQKVPILTDKPITAPADLMPDPRFTEDANKYAAAHKIKADVFELVELTRRNPGSRVLVMVQKRQHEGYAFLQEKLDEIIKCYKIPITYIQIHHSDGMWNMPTEFRDREGHPYKYGYGKLMHSGYHYLDLMHTFINLNLQVKNKRPDVINIFNQVLRPSDHYAIFNGSDYKRILGLGDYTLHSNSHGDDDFITYGELDSYSQLQFLRKGKVVTTAQLSFLQSGFSQRAWTHLPIDTFKSNGRVHMESVNIHIGPLYNLQVQSYRDFQSNEQGVASENIGGSDHFDIHIFKNSNLLGGKPFELIKFGEIYRQRHANDESYIGPNEMPRYQLIDQLLDNLPSNSELDTHLTTNALMAAFYSNHAKQQFGEVPFESYKFEDMFYEC
jgi:predicted dehydrogenase